MRSPSLSLGSASAAPLQRPLAEVDDRAVQDLALGANPKSYMSPVIEQVESERPTICIYPAFAHARDAFAPHQGGNVGG